MPIGITRWIAPVGPASKAIKADFSFYYASMLSGNTKGGDLFKNVKNKNHPAG